jgi:hypothetical protein
MQPNQVYCILIYHHEPYAGAKFSGSKSKTMIIQIMLL